jgi:hypothetical protein
MAGLKPPTVMLCEADLVEAHGGDWHLYDRISADGQDCGDPEARNGDMGLESEVDAEAEVKATAEAIAVKARLASSDVRATASSRGVEQLELAGLAVRVMAGVRDWVQCQATEAVIPAREAG